MATQIKQDLAEVIRRTIAAAYDEGEDKQYQAAFSDEGVRKSQYIIDHLKTEELLSPVRLVELGYFSIGGADGSEIEAVMEATGIRKGLLLEYDQRAAEAAAKRAEKLRKSGKELKIVIGDATTQMESCLKILSDWRDSNALTGLVCSAQGVLHELPMRSKDFKLPIFVGKLFRGGWGACYFYSREPGMVEGWPSEVQIRIPNLSGAELVRYARYVSDRLNFKDSVQEELADNWVVMSSNLAIETLHKLIRGDSLPRRGYEFGERLTSLDPIKLAELLERAVPGMRVNVDRVTTTGFKEALKLYGVEYRTTEYAPLMTPKTHAEIIGVHCTLPERPQTDSARLERGFNQTSEASVDLSDVDVERIFQGEVSLSHVELWLSQFDLADRWAILRALNSFEYVGQQKTSKLCTVLHERILAAVQGAPVKYVAFGGPGRSGGLITYEFSRANSLTSGDVIDPSAILSVHPGTVIVLLDDIVATGHQAVQELSRLGSCINNKRIILGVLAATSEGVRYVEEHSNVEVISGMGLASDDNPLLSGSDSEAIRGVFHRYGTRVLPQAPLGYYGGAHLIAFRHAAPDNSPPVFWASKGGWAPLLLRGGSQRTGYIPTKL